MGQIRIEQNTPKHKANYLKVYNIAQKLKDLELLNNDNFSFSIYDFMEIDYRTIMRIRKMLIVVLNSHPETLKLLEKEKLFLGSMRETDVIEFKKKKNEYLMPITVLRGLLKFPLFFNQANEKRNDVSYTIRDPYNAKNFVTLSCKCENGVPNLFDNNVYYASMMHAEQSCRYKSTDIRSICTQKQIAKTLELSYQANRSTIHKSVNKLYDAKYEKVTHIDGIEMTEKFSLISNLTYISAKKAKLLFGQEVLDGSNKVYIIEFNNKALDYTLQYGHQLVESNMMFIKKGSFVKTRLYQILQADRYKYYNQEVSYDIDELKAQIPLESKNETSIHNVLRDAFFKLQDEGYLEYKRIDKQTNTILFKFPPKSHLDDYKFLDRRMEKNILENLELLKKQNAEKRQESMDDNDNIVEAEYTCPNEKIPTPQPKNTQQESELIKLIHQKISPQVSERTIKELIKSKSIETIHIYINYVIWRIENQKPMKSISGWFVHALKNEISFDEDYQKKIDYENKMKAQQKEDKERAEFNKKHIDDIDCVGAKDFKVIIQKREELLNYFNKHQLNKLIQIKLETPELIDGYTTKFKYRFEAIEAIYKFIFYKVLFDDNPNRQEEAVEKLTNLANGVHVNHEDIVTQTLNDLKNNIELLTREEEKIKSDIKAKEDEQRKKQEHFKQTHYDEELKNVSIQKYETYYNNKKALIEIFTSDEYRTVIDSKKERLIKQNIKPVTHDIIQDVYVNLFEKKNVNYKEALEMQLDRSIEVESLEYDLSENQKVVYTPQENTYHKRYEENVEVEMPSIQKLQEKINAITPLKIETKIDEHLKVISKNDEITGEQLKEAREKAGMSTRELGELINVDQSLIVKWENNKRPVSKKKILKIMEVLHITN